MHPDKEAGKGSPEPHDTPVQPEESRMVIAPLLLRLSSQMPKRAIGRYLDMNRVSTGAKELALKIKEGRNVVTQGLKNR